MDEEVVQEALRDLVVPEPELYLRYSDFGI
jgi:hypothetical protein